MQNSIRTLKSKLDRTGELLLAVRVQSGASCEGMEVEEDGTLKVKVRAPREKGKANKRLVDMLSRAFGAPRSGIVILRGLSSTRKRVRIER